MVFKLALPYLGKDFDAGPKSLGYVASIAGAGTMASFLVMVLADRFGRRPVLLYSIVGYSLFSFLTAFSTGLIDYSGYQFAARMLLVGGQGVSYVILAEELPARHRGFGIELMFAAGIFGGIVGSGLFPYFIETTLWYSAIFIFWTYFAMNERGWDPHRVSKVLMVGLALSMVSQLVTGIALDRLGRRITSYLLFIVAALSAFGAFRAENPWVMSALYIVALSSVSIMTICLTISSELFPTEIRASANAVANNLLGRIGIVIGPTLVGILSVPLGSVGEAVSLIGLVALPCVAVVYFLVPETKGKVLEEIF